MTWICSDCRWRKAKRASSLVTPWLVLGHGIVVSSLVFILIAIVAWRLIFLHLGRVAPLQERLRADRVGVVAGGLEGDAALLREGE